MNNSFQTRHLWLVILGLLLLNLTLLGWIWFSPQNNLRLGGQSPGDFLEQQLKFTTKQKEQFKLLREDHHRKTQTIRDTIRLLKKEFFGKLKKPLSDAEIAHETAAIAQKMATIDKITFRHFRDIRQICTPQQQDKFDNMVDELLRHLGSEGRGGPPPRGEKMGQPIEIQQNDSLRPQENKPLPKKERGEENNQRPRKEKPPIRGEGFDGPPPPPEGFPPPHGAPPDGPPPPPRGGGPHRPPGSPPPPPREGLPPRDGLPPRGQNELR